MQVRLLPRAPKFMETSRFTRLDSPSHDEMALLEARGYHEALSIYADGIKRFGAKVPKRIVEAIASLERLKNLTPEEDPNRTKLDTYIDTVLMPLSRDMQTHNPEHLDYE